MGAVALLLDKYKTATSTPSDNAVAEHFGVTRQTVSQWRNGTAYPVEDTIVALAEGAKQDAGGWLNFIRAERCTGPAATAYRKIARSLGIAAVLCLAFYTSVGTRPARAAGFDNNSDVLGITHLRAWLARILPRLRSLIECKGPGPHVAASVC